LLRPARFEYFVTETADVEIASGCESPMLVEQHLRRAKREERVVSGA
jgi:hypothetical protein